MPYMSRFKRSHLPVFILTSVWLGSSLFSLLPALAGSAVTFNPPRGGAPQQTRGGASRGEVCVQSPTEIAPQLVALIPPSDQILTLKAHPTFFVYVPPTSAQAAFFSLRNETGQVTYQTTLPIVATGGILRVDLPDTAPALEVGQSYQWGIALLCSGKLRPDSPFVNSWVQRSQPSGEMVADTAPSLERAALYGSSGIWYDTLSTLADLQQQQPNNAELTTIWQNLLNSVQLNSVSSALLLKAS
jgi:hypothetical protein